MNPLPSCREIRNERVRTFMAHYDIELAKEPDGAGKRAAMIAGYSEKTAAAQASRMLRLPGVRDALAAARKERERRLEVSLAEMVGRHALIARSDLRQAFTKGGALLPIEAWPDELAAAVQSVEVTTRRTGEVDENGHPIYENVHKIKLEPKTPAQSNLIRVFGGYDGRRPGDDSEQESGERPLSELELAKMICLLLAKVRQRGETIEHQPQPQHGGAHAP